MSMEPWNRLDEGRKLVGWVLGYWEDAEIFAVCCADGERWSVVIPGQILSVDPPSHWMHLPSQPNDGDCDEGDDDPCSFCLERGCNGECI